MNAVRNYQKELDKITNDIISGSVPTLFLHSCCAPCSSYVLEYLWQYFRITVFYYNPNITEEQEYRKRVAEQKRLIAAYNEEAQRIRQKDAEAKKEVQQAGQRNAAAKKEAPQAGQKDAAAMQEAPQAGQRDAEAMRELDGVGYNYPSGGQEHRMPYEIKIEEGNYETEHFYEIARGLEQCPEGGERCFACYALRLRETAKRARAGGYDYFTTTLTISPLKNAAKLNEIGEAIAKEYGITWLPSDFKKKNGYKRSIELSREYDLYRQDYCGCVYSRVQREQERREGNGAALAAGS